MEALHAIRAAPSLSWRDSFSRNGRVWDSTPAMHHQAVLGPCCAPLLRPTMDKCLAQWNVGGSPRIPRYNFLGQRRGTAGVNAVASPFLTSDDDEETYIPVRVKMLQDAVGPNKTLLDAQARVCTGPTQTRPLDEAQAFKVLNTILQSANGELPNSEKVSKAQMGAFFGAMTLRANCFALPTQWSEGERKALSELWPALCECLPEEVLFLADPEGTIMGGSSNAVEAPTFSGNSTADALLVSALRELMMGRHLEHEKLTTLLECVLPLQGSKGEVSDALLAAFMICSRMIGETDRELDAYCMTFDEELGSVPIAKVKSLTHYGEPYDGNTRFFRSSLFVAAVRASYGETCLLHGIDWMPPKGGVTEELMLKFMGANTTLTPKEAVRLLEDKGVGFAYISQREARPSLYSLVDLREHIKKRPPIATTEKVQHYIKVRCNHRGPEFILVRYSVQGSGREAMIASFYHEGYEDPLLKLIRGRGVQAGLVIKGEEGALSLTTKDRSVDAVVKGRPLNYVAGFRPRQTPISDNTKGDLIETFTLELDAIDYGFAPSSTPRTDKSVAKNVELGMAALRGEKGPAYDRIVLNAAVADHLLGCEGAESPIIAVERAKEAIDSGRALDAMLNYIDRSKWPAGTPLPTTD